MEALKIGKDDNVAVPNWVESRREGVGDVGEHAVKQFMNIRVKSSKEEVTVHAKNDLVSNWCSVFLCCVMAYTNVSCQYSGTLKLLTQGDNY